ncbi:MAG: acyl-homoserine-lactone synthase [Sphingomonas sp.]
MVTLINRYNKDQHRDLLAAMHAARKRIFVDLLGWRIPHDGTYERDAFDDDDAVYLVVDDPDDGAHLASARLLRTDRPHILGALFPQLCEGKVPSGPDVREITRFCLAPGIGRAARLAARKQLVRSFVEYALLAGIQSFTGVAEMGWLTQVLSAGWDVRPLGLPQVIDGSLLGALEITITAQTLHQLAPEWTCDPSLMRVVEFDLPLAA